MINILSGPVFAISLLIFLVGMVIRIVLYIRGLDWRLDRVAYGAQWKRGLPGAISSIFQWLLPGGTRGWRSQPIIAGAFFLFHAGAVLLPLFLLGHTVILEELIGISLPALPMLWADVLTVLTLVGLAFLVWRRFCVAEARALTTAGDWFIIVITALPFISGFAARLTPSETWTIVHLLSGDFFLIVAPFTKLSHIVLFFLTRAQIGMDFAIKRGGQTRGPAFPW